jgi:hypothetical protein
MKGLGDLPDGYFNSESRGVSGDGETIVGIATATFSIPQDAFIWHRTHGMRSLKSYLIGLGVDLTGWSLTSAEAISADGTTIVGYGGSPAGRQEAWVANIVTTVAIDIKPGTSPNSLNLKSKGVVPVAILSGSTFNVTQVNVNTVVFAGALPEKFSYDDVNADGLTDLVFHFRTQDLQLGATSMTATLTGKTLDGDLISGADYVNLVPPKR